jgi:hypothetical protein
MTPFEKLLLRRARNSDLKRSAQWLCNLAYTTTGADIWRVDPTGKIGQMLDKYGVFTETEDPEALSECEDDLGSALQAGLLIDDENTAIG